MSHAQSNRREALAGLGLFAAVSALGAAPADPISSTLKAQGEAKLKAAREILDYCREALIAPPQGGARGETSSDVVDDIERWSRVVVETRLELAANRDERLAILGEEVKRSGAFADEIRELIKGESSGLSKLSLAKADFYRLDAEIRLASEKARG